MNFLKDCLRILTEFADVKNIINEMPVFPNQKGNLCIHGELHKEQDFPTNEKDNVLFKDFYERVVNKIYEKLVHKEFIELLPNDNVKKAIELSSAIEQELKKHAYDKISEHPYKDIVFNIIQKITGDKEWANLFPDLDSRKAVIMMAKITDEDVKNDLFAIIGLEDKNKIAALGGLSQNPDMHRIIDLGQKALTVENENQRNWGFKKEIGIYIEDMVRKEIAGQVKSFDIILLPQQDGQDMIAKLNGETVYFIEVKSQWVNNDSVTMSYAQSRRSVVEQEQYALCTVDLLDYMPGQEKRFTPPREVVCERARFVTNIGEKVEELIKAAIIADRDEHDVRLTDEYRVKVFQNIVENEGITFDSFITFLIRYLKRKYPNAFTK